jgi:FtsP/CotA-like multicopper oxidase with cupredoxin domain
MSDFSRRTFMTLAAGAAAGVATAAAEISSPSAHAAESGPEQTAANDASAEPFHPDVVLDAGFVIKTIDGLKVKLRAYNGQVPGPLIKTKAGRTLKVRVKNSLPVYDSSAWGGDMDVPHMLDHTNLHLHGLDIAPHIFDPLGTSDPLAPMIAIGPGEYKDYPFVIPPDQSPGLNWYHPHCHGSTAVQAVSGMAGPLIIEGAIDEVPEIKAAKDYLLVVSDLGLFPTNEPHADYSDSYEPRQNAIWQTFNGNVPFPPGLVTINGNPTAPPQSCGFTTGDYALRYYALNGEPFFKEVHNSSAPTSPTPTQLTPPVYKMRPGEVARFRMVNACSDLMMPIQVEGHNMWLLAMDGNNFNAPLRIPSKASIPQVQLGPANRAEFLIKAVDKPGNYNITQLAQSQQFLTAVQKTIAVIQVDGHPVDMGIPQRLPPITRDPPILDSEIKRVRYFVFSSTFPGVQNPVVGIDFRINNQLYDESAVPTTVALGDCEEWHIIVPNSEHGGTEGHPFHIHVNDFEVKSVGGIAQRPGLIQDTIWVQQNTAAVIRMRFKEWVGKAVFHCHILPHEDTGMMQNFLIVKQRPAHHHEKSIESLGENHG